MHGPKDGELVLRIWGGIFLCRHGRPAPGRYSWTCVDVHAQRNGCRATCRAVGTDACAWWQLEVPPSETVDGEFNNAATRTFKVARGNGSARVPHRLEMCLWAGDLPVLIKG